METTMSIEHWDIDSNRSGITFAVRHLLLTKTRGRFGHWSGTVIVPDGDFSRATVDVVVDAASINTGVVRRDQHLRSADYLDVRRYPYITFTSRRVSVEPDGRLRVDGALKIRDVTREVSLKVVPYGRMLDPQGNEHAEFSAKTTIDRRDFGFTGNLALDAGGIVIGEQIEVQIQLEALVQPAARAA